MIWLGVDDSRSSPRTTSVTPWSASSTTTARLYAGTPSLRCNTTSSTLPAYVPLESIDERLVAAITAQAQRGGAAGLAERCPLAIAEVATCARVSAIGIGPMWRLGGQSNLAARAEALVHQAVGAQALDGLEVERETVRLTHHFAVPIESDAAERGQLLRLVKLRRRHPIQILHPHQISAVARSGDQPRDERRSEVAEVQRPGRRRRKSADHRVIFHGRCDVGPCDMTGSK